jgi:arylsulfatase A-like enzyme
VLFKPIGRQRLALYVNGKVVAQPELKGGWQQVRADLPDGLAKPGFVHVRLLFRRGRSHAGTRTAAALRYVRLGPRESTALPEEETALARALGRTSGDDLLLPDGGGLDYYVTPVKGLRLRGEVRGGKAAISAQLDGGTPKQLAVSDKLDVSLDAYDGKAVRLMLRGQGASVQLVGAGLVGAKPGPALKIKKPRYVVFWLIDALRADKLDFYGRRGNDKPAVKTPNLSALASEGVVFDPFVVPSNESKAGHASYWTGTYPAIHRVLHRPDKLRESHLTIAELFRDAGYSTAAFVSNGFISKRWNYHQGFQSLVNFIREDKPNSAKAVVNAAIPWINRHKAGPFYLYLGTSDTHVTYRVHKRFIKDYDKGPYRGPYRRYLSGESLGKIKQRKRPPPPRERDRIEAIYDNEAAFNDHHFGRLVAHLKKLGIHDQTLYIVNSDHGEEFWEHGSCGHGHNLHRELVSVPFVLRLPGVLPAGKVTTGHDGVDLLPTLMALMGVKPPEEVQGESLLPYLGASSAYPGAMVASDAAWSYTLEIGHAKVIMRSRVAIDVYDLTRDPVEKRDLFKTHPVLTLAALDPLSLFIGRAERWRKRTWGTPNNLTRSFPEW